jgi:hypothetical protein
MKKLIIAALVATAVTGCSSSPDTDMAKRLLELEQANKEMREQRIAEQQQKLEETLDVAPDWYLSPPGADSTGFYGVGYAQSKNIGHGKKAARLQAEFDLAKMYRQELSGSERSFERGDNEGGVQTQTTFLVDKIVDSVPVVGYTVVEQKLIPVNGVYEAYVLLKLPFDEFNRVLMSERAKTFDKTVQSQFDDLERRLKERRAEKEAAEQAAFSREQEALRTRADILKQANKADPEPEKTLKLEHPVQTLLKGN